MQETWFTADTHFQHWNIAKYCNRPFTNKEEMDETMIERWNSKVKKKDIVYHLGDFAFAGEEYIKTLVRRLNGDIRLIKGNHDKFSYKKYLEFGFRQCLDYKKIKIANQKIIMSHYAMRTWDCSYHGSWMLFGHSHGALQDHYIFIDDPIGEKDYVALSNTMDVGVDTNNFYPYSFDDIKNKIPKTKSIM